MSSYLEAMVKDKLYAQNEYGYKFRDLSVELTQDEINYFADEYGIDLEYQYKSGVKVPLRPMCMSCKAAHILKYKDHPNITTKGGFEIDCKGVPGALPPGSNQVIKEFATKNEMDIDRAKKVFSATVDPVHWFELMFNFKDKTEQYLRSYQKDELRCTSKRRALRWGRRMGKTFTACAWMLHSVFNEFVLDGYDEHGTEVYRGPTILVVTPFQAQLTNIFEQLESLIKKNIDLRKQVTTGTNGGLYVQSPFFRMEFESGAKIYGFVTGVELKLDGSAGGALRGQSAHKVYVDEMDMIPEDIIKKVVVPILFTTKDTEFLVSSTPIGKAGKFLEFCKNSPRYRESYYPTTCLPHWDQVKQEIESTDPSDDGFIAEYMAEFVESSTSVFKSLYVYDALKEYSYSESQPDNGPWWREFAKVSNRSDLINVIGIDWNKNAGSEFVVVSYHPQSNQWWLSEASNVSASEFSSIGFKDEVKRLNYKWKPRYIYADEGWGHHIIEDLQYEAQQLLLRKPVSDMEIQISKLGTRLKSFNFSQRVDLKNPIDGTSITRTGKEFLVENAVRVFESGNLRFSVGDNVLRKQLLNYIVLRRHPSNNRPVYGMKTESVGDHRLDALMLALGGIFLELNPLYSKNFWSGRTILTQMAKVDGEEKERLPAGLQMIKGLTLKQEPKTEVHRREFPMSNSPSSVFESLLEKAKTRNLSYDPDKVEHPNAPINSEPRVSILKRQRPNRRASWQ
jgi:Terminase large subunit, T4likevirus-type, N-terminal